MIDGVTPHQQQDQAHRAVTSARSQKQQNHEAVATPVCQRPQNTATPPSRQHWVGKAAAAWPAPDAAQVAAAARGAAAAAAAAAASLPPASSSFECDECPRSFATEKGMRQHHSMMHKGMHFSQIFFFSDLKIDEIYSIYAQKSVLAAKMNTMFLRSRPASP